MTRKRPRLFYGWWIVATSALGLFLGPPLYVYSFGVFFKSFAHDFHSSRAAISFAFTLLNTVGALCLLANGRLIDRFGARRVIIPATGLYALVLLSALALGNSIWQFYLFCALLGLAASGPNPVSYSVVISHWFNRRRGLALGVMMLGIGIGAFVVPLAAQRLIAAFGWRMAYAIFGGAVLLLPLPVVAANLRNDPGERGLRTDGDEITQTPSEPPGKEGLNWHEIWHSPTFWLLICVFCLTGASVHAAILHMAALLTDRGLSAERAALATSVIGISLVFGRVGSGYLLDHLFAPRVAIFFYGASALGMAMLWAGRGGNAALAAAFLVGLGMGAEVEVMAFLISRYFGLRAFASAYGHAFGAFMISGALGVWLMGAGFDRAHSYTLPLAGFCIAMVIALGLLTRLGPYRYGLEAEEMLPHVRAASGA
ncbi:MAG: MFS transporter [Acidobacteriaceae bacterium]